MNIDEGVVNFLACVAVCMALRNGGELALTKEEQDFWETHNFEIEYLTSYLGELIISVKEIEGSQ